jgi:hypothetical protein
MATIVRSRAKPRDVQISRVARAAGSGPGQGRTIGTARRKGRGKPGARDRPATPAKPAPPQLKMRRQS